MPKTEYVVLAPSGVYLTQVNESDPVNSLYGNVESAIVFESQEAANSMAERVNSGTVGTTKP